MVTAMGLNNAQKDWAAQHDWYRSCFVNAYNLYTVMVYDSELDDEIPMTDYNELRSWAGY